MSFDPRRNVSTFSKIMGLHARPPQTQDNYNLGFMRNQQVSTEFVNRLGLHKELKGHQGCVNCLEWSADGSLLASGSDDCTAIVWDPHRGRSLARIHTGHTGNIFSVNFLPHSGNGTLATGAADSRVIVSDVATRQPVASYHCHSQRVKRLATARDSAALFWSASEDGTVRQFDLRDRDNPGGGSDANHQQHQARNVLVDLHCLLQGSPEAKCLSVNPCRSEALAVGANDHCVRLFDRRKLSLTRALVHSHRPAGSSTEAGLTSETGLLDTVDGPDVGAYVKSAQYYIPGHLTRDTKPQRHRQQVAVTYLTFSPDGRDLVANLGGEQVYTVPVVGRQQPVLQLVPSQLLQQQQQQNGHSPRVPPALSPAAQDLKSRANAELQRDRPFASVRLYTEALRLAPGSPVLLGNRAAALLKRCWAGDAYAAALDCEAALTAEPGYYKALYRLARAFLDLGWTPEAGQCVAAFRQLFPQHADAASFKQLAADVVASAADSGAGGSRASAAAGSQSASRLFRSHHEALQPLEAELQLRARALDLRQRFVGHCNTTTDIKEANFFGRHFLLAGSDEGKFFVWDRRTGALVRAINGDESIVNCLQPHPTSCLLATSGIESVVRLWSPQPSSTDHQEQQQPASASSSSADTTSAADASSASDSSASTSAAAALDETVARNQRLMRADPLELMLRSMGYRLVPAAAAGAAVGTGARARARATEGDGGSSEDDEEDSDDDDDDAGGGSGDNAAGGERGCRTS